MAILGLIKTLYIIVAETVIQQKLTEITYEQNFYFFVVNNALAGMPCNWKNKIEKLAKNDDKIMIKKKIKVVQIFLLIFL